MLTFGSMQIFLLHQQKAELRFKVEKLIRVFDFRVCKRQKASNVNLVG